MLKKTIALSIFFISFFSFSQETEFNTVLNKIAADLKTVQNSKSTFNQKITSEQLGVILFNSSETNSKGKTKEIIYQLNLSDIDVNTIRPLTKKDVIMVQMIVKNNQKMIKKIENNEKISFVNKMFILANNIDNARVLTDLFKKISPISNQITENRLSLSGYDDRLAWLQKNIVDVSLINTTFNQNFIASENNIGNVTFSSSIVKKKSTKNKKSQFNLSNINPNTIFFKSKGSEFILSLETKRKLKTIKIFEDDEQKNYTNVLKINCSDVENARDLQKVIKDIIPLAKKKFSDSYVEVLSLEEGVEVANNKIETITTNKRTIHQSFSKNLVSTFSKKIIDPKKEIEFIYNFNFIDINKDDIEVSINGTEVLLILKTNFKNKFIKQVENDELQNYTNKIEIFCNSIEEAYRLKNTFAKIIGLHDSKQLEKLKYSNIEEGVSELKKNIFGVKVDKYTYEQSISLKEENENKILKLTNVKISEKKSEENIQEFNLFDVNPKSIEIVVSGKKVMVKFYTNFQEKIIKTYKDGNIKSYTNQATIFSTDIENARKIKRVLFALTTKK